MTASRCSGYKETSERSALLSEHARLCFWKSVDKQEPTACWLWTGAKSRDGYGKFQTDGRTHRAHRVSYEEASGTALGQLHALHRCDTPLCVNPAHLFAGTPKDNTADMIAKGRKSSISPAGVQHTSAKLTEADVLEIRRLGRTKTLKQIATQFGINNAGVCRILQRKTWKHLPKQEGDTSNILYDHTHRGADHHRATLSDTVVAAIRVATGTQRDIAKHFGVSQQHVSDLRSGVKRQAVNRLLGIDTPVVDVTPIEEGTTE